MTDIPPLAALRAFAATIRFGGFARAAAGLNVSTSAISHQIRSLEASLGVRLLDRSTGMGGVKVTEAGAQLLPAIHSALALLDEACSDIRGATKRLTVSANGPFSTLWLARRLAEFSSLHPQTQLNAIIQDDEPAFARFDIDLAVVHVHERTLCDDDIVLFREKVFPVCSPELQALASTSVCRCRLLQETHDDSPETKWANWTKAFGLPEDFASKVVRYSSFSQVVGAAVGGAGLALGRSPLIDPELKSGRLVRVFPDVSRPAAWCFVLRRGPGKRHRMLGPLVDFLRAEAQPAFQFSAIANPRSEHPLR